MAISVIASGGGSDKLGGVVADLFEMTADDWLFVATTFDKTLSSLTAMEYAATPLTNLGSPVSSDGLTRSDLWAYRSSGDAETDLIFAIDIPAAMVMTWMIVRGLAVSPNDKTEDDNHAGSTTPSSGSTAATTLADEILIGFAATAGPPTDTAGSWSGSFTGVQRTGTVGGLDATNRTLSLAYRIVSATGTYAAAKTGITSRPWVAMIHTFKQFTPIAGGSVVPGTPGLSASMGLSL